jgi:hypothetical protein
VVVSPKWSNSHCIVKHDRVCVTLFFLSLNITATGCCEAQRRHWRDGKTGGQKIASSTTGLQQMVNTARMPSLRSHSTERPPH